MWQAFSEDPGAEVIKEKGEGDLGHRALVDLLRRRPAEKARVEVGKMGIYLGIDIGSVTTKVAALAGDGELIGSNYLRTQGKPIVMVQQGLKDIAQRLPPGSEIGAVGTTGSARYLGGVVVGADVVKNEITAQAIAALHYVPDVQTIIEIGGQDSKLIILRDGVVAESDMIHKQQMGHRVEDILYGLCQALVRNYLNNVGLGKEILPPVVFQGGVAFNRGIVRAFEETLNTALIVPPHHEVMGAIGAGLLAREEISRDSNKTKFKGFEVSEADYRTSSFECKACANLCEIAQISLDGGIVARWGGRCDLWERTAGSQK
jgi:activator of 2-hydroxyglutaryl-CoA dehydratase